MSIKSSQELLNARVGRRTFLKLGAMTAIGATGLSAATESVQDATTEQLKEMYPGSKKVKTICTHCSVGCGVVAEVANGVWVRQEVAYDHPVSLGGHCCCKGVDEMIVPNILRLPF